MNYNNVLMQWNNLTFAELDISKVNNAWLENRIPIGGIHDKKNESEQSLKIIDIYDKKYVNSCNDLEKGVVFTPPIIKSTIFPDKIMFIDGRNRFANIRDSGVLRMRFLISGPVKNITNLCS